MTECTAVTSDTCYLQPEIHVQSVLYQHRISSVAEHDEDDVESHLTTNGVQSTIARGQVNETASHLQTQNASEPRRVAI